MTSTAPDGLSPLGSPPGTTRSGAGSCGPSGTEPGRTPPAGLEQAARDAFGPALPRAERYAALLAEQGPLRGLIGPREVPRLWERHLLNSVVVAELLPAGARVLDLGSGAGLPGVPLALARTDIQVDLLDSMQRRTVFLAEVVKELDLAGRVRVVRARAEQHTGRYDAVVARAVAPLPLLADWSRVLLGDGGLLLALRGQRAEEELRRADPGLRRAGWSSARVLRVGMALPVPTTVVRVRR